MEPSTPPRAHGLREVPRTPATPRYGTFEDLPDGVRKHARTRTPHRTPHRRKRSATELATPRQTPHKRKVSATPRQLLFAEETLKSPGDSDNDKDTQARPKPLGADSQLLADSDLELEGESEGTEEEESEEEDVVQATRVDQQRLHSGAAQRVITDTPADALRPTHKKSDVYAELGHPHQEQPPPEVPGMWYVFRGKKVFRPLPAGAKPVEPITLFKKEIDAQRRVAESEEDTDVETLWE